MPVGEVLSLKHVEQLAKWEARPGPGRLSIYTREVTAVMTDASGDERPPCELEPEKAHSVQHFYRRHK